MHAKKISTHRPEHAAFRALPSVLGGRGSFEPRRACLSITERVSEELRICLFAGAMDRLIYSHGQCEQVAPPQAPGKGCS